jgi:hypothetical protein
LWVADFRVEIPIVDAGALLQQTGCLAYLMRVNCRDYKEKVFVVDYFRPIKIVEGYE